MNNPWNLDDETKENFLSVLLSKLRAMRLDVDVYCKSDDRKLRLLARLTYKVLGIMIRRLENYDNIR